MLGFDSPVLKLMFWTVLTQASESLWPAIAHTSACMDHHFSICHLPERACTLEILVFQALESLLDSDLIQIFAAVEKNLVSRMGAALADGGTLNPVSSALPHSHDTSPQKDL